MKRVMVRYKVKPAQAAENEAYIAHVFAQLRERAPDGLQYASFKLEDGLSFVHIAFVDTPDGQNPLQDLTAFGEFTADIRSRCDEPPVAVELTEIGSYRFA